jgi:hypothetical protein
MMEFSTGSSISRSSIMVEQAGDNEGCYEDAEIRAPHGRPASRATNATPTRSRVPDPLHAPRASL